jgi:hypothetical protein
MRNLLLLSMIAGLSSVLGCAKAPTRVVEFRGPANVVYTVETWEDNGGALSSDYSRVYAGLVGGKRSDKLLVMDGAYLEISHVDWSSPNNVTICLSGGHVTSLWRSTVLRGSGRRVELTNHLDERCAGGPPFQIK